MIRKILIAIVALFLFAAGITAAYLYFSVPNDLGAESLLREARGQLKKGDREAARLSLQNVVKEYPRTDASSAAIYALFEIAEGDRQKVKHLETEVRSLRRTLEQERSKLAAVDTRLTELANRKPPPPPVVAKPTPKPVAKTPVKRTTTRRRR